MAEINGGALQDLGAAEEDASILQDAAATEEVDPAAVEELMEGVSQASELTGVPPEEIIGMIADEVASGDVEGLDAAAAGEGAPAEPVAEQAVPEEGAPAAEDENPVKTAALRAFVNRRMGR